MKDNTNDDYIDFFLKGKNILTRNEADSYNSALEYFSNSLQEIESQQQSDQIDNIDSGIICYYYGSTLLDTILSSSISCITEETSDESDIQLSWELLELARSRFTHAIENNEDQNISNDEKGNDRKRLIDTLTDDRYSFIKNLLLSTRQRLGEFLSELYNDFSGALEEYNSSINIATDLFHGTVTSGDDGTVLFKENNDKTDVLDINSTISTEAIKLFASLYYSIGICNLLLPTQTNEGTNSNPCGHHLAVFYLKKSLHLLKYVLKILPKDKNPSDLQSQINEIHERIESIKDIPDDNNEAIDIKESLNTKDALNTLSIKRKRDGANKDDSSNNICEKYIDKKAKLD